MIEAERPRCQRQLSQWIRLEEYVSERIEAQERADESFSEAVERLIGGRSLRYLREVFDEEQGAETREAIEKADQRDREQARAIAERFD